LKIDRLQQIKYCGQSIIDNAESILGDEKFRQDLKIIVEFQANEIPTIKVERRFIPESVVKHI